MVVSSLRQAEAQSDSAAPRTERDPNSAHPSQAPQPTATRPNVLNTGGLQRGHNPSRGQPVVQDYEYRTPLQRCATRSKSTAMDRIGRQ